MLLHANLFCATIVSYDCKMFVISTLGLSIRLDLRDLTETNKLAYLQLSSIY
jgi:hypothetical protein